MKNLHDSSLSKQELARISKFLHSSMFGSRFGTVRLVHYQKLRNPFHIRDNHEPLSLKPRKINVLVLIRKKLKNDEGGRFLFIYLFLFWNWKINILVLIRKNIEKWRGWVKIRYHQKNACISRVSQNWVFEEERSSFFCCCKIRQGSWWEPNSFFLMSLLSFFLLILFFSYLLLSIFTLLNVQLRHLSVTKACTSIFTLYSFWLTQPYCMDLSNNKCDTID